MYANEFKTKEKQKLTEIKKLTATYVIHITQKTENHFLKFIIKKVLKNERAKSYKKKTKTKTKKTNKQKRNSNFILTWHIATRGR